MEEVRTHLLIVYLLRFGLSGLLDSLSIVTLEWFGTLFTPGVYVVEMGSVVEASAVTHTICLLRVHTVTNVHVILIVCDGRDDLYIRFRLALEVVASIVKRSLNETGIVILESVVPVFLVRKNVIQNTGIPLVAWSKDHMWKFVKLFVGVGGHLHVHEAIDDVEWNDVTFHGVNVLDTSHFHGSVMYPILVVFNMSTRVDGAVDTVICVLSKYGDYRTALCGDESGCIHEFEGIHLVIIDASHVYATCVCEGYASVTAEYTSVSSSIH
jgi:hypothetical protein